jgi:cell division control protein 6
VCKKRGLAVTDETALVGMIQLLESRGMVAYTAKGAPRYARVTLRLDEKEVEMALQDKTLLASILEDVSCLAS